MNNLKGKCIPVYLTQANALGGGAVGPGAQLKAAGSLEEVMLRPKARRWGGV